MGSKRGAGYAVVRFSRASVDRAGRLLVEGDTDDEVREAALDTVANWRSSHAFPLNSITVDLKQKVKRVQAGGIVAQRIKRARSILGKLITKPSMRLTQMQDIGGCRAIVSSVEAVYRLRELYLSSRSLNELVSHDDYIVKPKQSGYRGLHLVFRFKSRSHPEYDRLLFEVQLRTFTQHAWATAVETVGAVLGQALKASEGEGAWLRYFECAALALEFSESPALGATVPAVTRGDVARELLALDKSLQVHAKLTAYGEALKATEDFNVKSAGYFLLVLVPGELDMRQPELQIFSFSKRNADLAYREYERFERLLPLYPNGQLPLFPEFANTSGAQAVLVGAESFKSIRESFPNYYLDTRNFLSKIDAFVRTYKRRR